MAIKLPKKIRIMNRDYKVIECATREEITPHEDSAGMFIPAKSEIRTHTTSQDDQQILGVLLHEIVHAISFSMAERDLYDNEAYTDRMAVALQCLFRDNDLSFCKIKGIT